MTRTGASVTSVGGAEAGHAIPEPPLSLPITDDYDWEDDFDFGSDDELPEEMMWPELGSAAPGDEPPGEPDEAWLDDPDAHHDEVVGYMKRLYAHCKSSGDFVAALKDLFPDLEEKIAKCRAFAAEESNEGCEPSPDADIAAGRVVTFLSYAEMIAAEMAEEPELDCV